MPPPLPRRRLASDERAARCNSRRSCTEDRFPIRGARRSPSPFRVGRRRRAVSHGTTHGPAARSGRGDSTHPENSSRTGDLTCYVNGEYALTLDGYGTHGDSARVHGRIFSAVRLCPVNLWPPFGFIIVCILASFGGYFRHSSSSATNNKNQFFIPRLSTYSYVCTFCRYFYSPRDLWWFFFFFFFCSRSLSLPLTRSRLNKIYSLIKLIRRPCPGASEICRARVRGCIAAGSTLGRSGPTALCRLPGRATAKTRRDLRE